MPNSHFFKMLSLKIQGQALKTSLGELFSVIPHIILTVHAKGGEYKMSTLEDI